MTPSTIPAAVAAHIAPDTPALVAIVEGEPDRLTVDGGSITRLNSDGSIRLRPPADLLALADADCLTCRGHGWQPTEDPRSAGGLIRDCPNPLCDPDRPGKLLVEVRVECGNTYCDQGVIRQDDGHMVVYCKLCSGNGCRTVTGRIAAVPILRFVFGSEMGDLPEIVVHKDTVNYWDGTGRIFRLDPSHIAALADVHGPPDTWPGKWGAAFTEVQR